MTRVRAQARIDPAISIFAMEELGATSLAGPPSSTASRRSPGRTPAGRALFVRRAMRDSLQRACRRFAIEVELVP